MRRTLLPALLLLAISSAPVHAAATTPPGVNLRWDQCYGDGGVQFKQFACDVNTGSERLVGSFELASDLPGVTGLEISLSIGSASATLPVWWTFNAPGGVIGCRGPALSVQLTPPAGSLACADWAGGQAAGGLSAYQLNRPDPSHPRLALGAAAPTPADVFAGQETFAFALTLNHTKTVGTGSCAGCLEPVVIFLAAIRVVPGADPGILLTTGANTESSQWVSWQTGYPTNIGRACGATGGGLFCFEPYADFDVVPLVTPTRVSTWGQVKSLYR